MEDNELSGTQKVYDMYSAGQSAALDDIYTAENVATDIKEMEHKIEFYKGLKKKKNEDIDNAIHSLEDKIEFYKSVITKTLQKWKEKTINFPGVCKISTRNPAPIWSITDEEAFIEKVKAEGEQDKVLEEIRAYKIIKKEANKLLAVWEKSGNIPNGVTKTEKEASVSITYYEPVEESGETPIDDSVPMKEPVFDKLSL